MGSSSLNELSGLLWRERDVLDLIVARIEDATGDWQTLLRSISSLELHRAITAREAALELGISGDATLDELAGAAPPEWSSILHGHAAALRALTSEIARLAHQTASVGGGGVDSKAAVQRSLRDFLG